MHLVGFPLHLCLIFNVLHITMSYKSLLIFSEKLKNEPTTRTICKTKQISLNPTKYFMHLHFSSCVHSHSPLANTNLLHIELHSVPTKSNTVKVRLIHTFIYANHHLGFEFNIKKSSNPELDLIVYIFARRQCFSYAQRVRIAYIITLWCYLWWKNTCVDIFAFDIFSIQILYFQLLRLFFFVVWHDVGWVSYVHVAEWEWWPVLSNKKISFSVRRAFHTQHHFAYSSILFFFSFFWCCWMLDHHFFSFFEQWKPADLIFSSFVMKMKSIFVFHFIFVRLIPVNTHFAFYFIFFLATNGNIVRFNQNHLDRWMVSNVSKNVITHRSWRRISFRPPIHSGSISDWNFGWRICSHRDVQF